MVLNSKKKKSLSNTFVTLLSVLLLLSSFKSNHIFSNYELICSQFKSYFNETNSDSKEKLNNSLLCKKCINNFSIEISILFDDKGYRSNNGNLWNLMSVNMFMYKFRKSS